VPFFKLTEKADGVEKRVPFAAFQKSGGDGDKLFSARTSKIALVCGSPFRPPNLYCSVLRLNPFFPCLSFFSPLTKEKENRI
jgi:hypothetical protein